MPLSHWAFVRRNNDGPPPSLQHIRPTNNGNSFIPANIPRNNSQAVSINNFLIAISAGIVSQESSIYAFNKYCICRDSSGAP